MHMNVHDESKPFKCDDCSKCFDRKSSLDQHHTSHSVEKPFLCKICNRKFALKSVFVEHQATHCKKPESQASSKSYLYKKGTNQHLQVYNESKASKKGAHLNVFSKQNDVKKHFKSKDMIFNCHICDKKFAIKANLVEHLATHSKVRYFKCTKCLESFREKHQLWQHMQFHKDTKFV